MNYRREWTLSIVAMAIVLIFLPLAWPQTTANDATPLIVGIWKLNPEKSNLRFPPDYMEVRQYRLRPDGFLVGLLITGNTQGYRYLQFTAKSDGKDYPEYSDQIVADMIAAGKQTPRTYSESIVDEYVTEWTDKVDGRITAQGRKIISSDRMVLTITTNGTSQQRVYDRQ